MIEIALIRNRKIPLRVMMLNFLDNLACVCIMYMAYTKEMKHIIHSITPIVKSMGIHVGDLRHLSDSVPGNSVVVNDMI